MNDPAGCTSIDLEIPIEATRETVWNALFDHTNDWWLDDFRMTSPDSTVTFDRSAGGKGIVEESRDGSFLIWYHVQMYLPSQFKVYLNGHIAPEWGGPTTSSLKLALKESQTGCVLQIADARHGHADESQKKTCEDGWRQLFTDGLKAFAESQ
ncbi:MAG: SRPBCC domain-containing protein [Pirellulaceae bacterium]